MKRMPYISTPIKNDGLSYDGQIDEIYSALNKMREQIEYILLDFERRLQKIESK